MKLRWIAVVAAVLALAACAKQDENKMQGWVEADLVFISPEEAGRLDSLNVREGQQVERGAALFTVDPELQQADVTVADANVTTARQSRDRARDLLKSASGTQKALEDAESALQQAEARLNAAKTRLARRQASSPVAGTIEEIYFRPGETVPAGRPVVSVLPPANVKVRFYVSQQRLPSLKPGDPVTVQCDGCDKDITAKISFIARSAEYTPPVIYSLEERSKLVFLVEARPDNPDKLRAGQPVTVTLVGMAK